MNAIILAAGLGSRFKEYTLHNHKALFPVCGIPNLERTIKYLNEANIYDIYIITGYLSHLFDFLEAKYHCKLIHNAHFKDKNNMYSFKKALPFLSQSFVIDSDVVLFENVFKALPDENQSYYFLIERQQTHNEWIPIINKENKITEIIVSSENKPSLLGVSFWSKEDCQKIKQYFEKITDDEYSNPALYWDDIPRKIISELNVNAIILEKNTATELDTFEDYQLVLSKK